LLLGSIFTYHVNLCARQKTKAEFIQPMLLLRTERLPEGPHWLYELKLDGDRTQAIKTGGKVKLRSRNDKEPSEQKYSATAAHCGYATFLAAAMCSRT
jgi:ATP-dependent DNA ligase